MTFCLNRSGRSPGGRVPEYAGDGGTGSTVTRKTTALLGLVALVVVGCGRDTPTSLDESLLPEAPTSVEIVLEWDDFASNLRVLGGYGAPQDLGRGIVANQFAGTLDARTLVVLDTFPTTASVRDTLGTTRPDSSLTYLGARVVATFDTISSTNAGPVTLALGVLDQEYDPATVTWEHAVDTINDRAANSDLIASSVLAG